MDILAGLRVEHCGEDFTVDEYLAVSHTDALVVMRSGKIVAEAYFGDTDRNSRHLLMSVSKSLCGLIVGRLIGDGSLSLSEPARRYVPKMAGGALGTATIAQLLDMTVAVDYSEDYRDANSHVRIQDRLAGWQPGRSGDPEATPDFLRDLRSNGVNGQRFQYCSAATDALAWVVATVTGLTYPQAISALLWQHLEVEDDAEITVEPGGFAFANGGISTTATDLAQVGQLVLNEGLVGTTRVIPASWIRDMCAGGSESAAHGTVFQRVHPRGSYHRQWWITGDDRGSIYAAGIHGQYIWVDPSCDVTIVKFSSLPVPVAEEWTRSHTNLFRSAADRCAALE